MSDEKSGELPPLRFQVAPHLVEDLGLNLYTSLPRVLVEYIANAFDADAKSMQITLDKTRINSERKILRARWEQAKAEAEAKKDPIPRLADMTLPAEVTISLLDDGHGMSRDDLANKFLIAGRRRRGPKSDDVRTPSGRIVMGRKGLGKLAGFGVAKIITLRTRAKGEPHATEIRLRYDTLIQGTNSDSIPIEEKRLDDPGNLKENGTEVILSELLYEPMGALLSTIESRAADHFAQIDPADFKIEMNGELIAPSVREHAYAWPEPDRPIPEFVEKEYEIEDGRKFKYQYRLRFVADRQALTAKERGIRVYAHKRLAGATSLLEADTNMHGFRMTDYLDGVVHADV
jgi:hypothetical protein